MNAELEAIQALAADYEDKTVMLSAESVAVLFYGLEAVKSLDYWKEDREETISDADADEIDRIVDTAFFEVMSEVEIPVMAYPTRAEMNHLTSTVLNGNALQWLSNSAQVLGGSTRQNASAVNDEWTNQFFLAAGTYTFYIIGIRQAGGGSLDLWVDETSWAQLDFYAAATGTNFVFSGSITIATDGIHKLRGKVVGKNPSSSGYVANISVMYFKKAAD